MLGGVPLISYSIVAGLQSQKVDRVIVSTDDAKTADIARAWGAEVPFMRPSDLAEDDTPDLPVFQHALKWLAKNEGYKPDVIVQLRPTSPVRPPDCVDQAVIILLSNEQADSVRAVVPSSQNPFKMWYIQDDGLMSPLLDTDLEEPYNLPRQKLPPTYWQTGLVDVMRYATLMEKESMTGRHIRPIVLDARYTIDIDRKTDWEQAELMIERLTLPFIIPTKPLSQLPNDIRLLILDFDGVFTDNRVWVTEQGKETVACHRADGMGLALLKAKGIEAIVLSTEKNPVVSARCKKLGINCVQSLDDKVPALMLISRERGIDLKNITYVGNDINDLGCMKLAGFAVSVADAHPKVLDQADLVLKSRGGHGAVRELCDKILSSKEQRDAESS